MRERIFGQPLSFSPGEKWQYSNLGSVLLGQIIRRVTGQYYGDFLSARIFEPAEMTTTRIISEADLVPHRAAGYQRMNGVLKNQEWVSPALNTTADGSLYFTVRDLARWDSALTGDGLLSRGSMAAIRTPVRLNDGSEKHDGFGWSLGTASGHAVMSHGGSWQGFKAYILRFPEDRLAVAVLANLAEATPAPSPGASWSCGIPRSSSCPTNRTPGSMAIRTDFDYIPLGLSGLGSGTGRAFKFVSVTGRILSGLAIDSVTPSDISAFAIEREILKLPNPPRSYLVRAPTRFEPSHGGSRYDQNRPPRPRYLCLDRADHERRRGGVGILPGAVRLGNPSDAAGTGGMVLHLPARGTRCGRQLHHATRHDGRGHSTTLGDLLRRRQHR
jgi:CubicO group peptidase (beta-lactamase class C family)